MRLSLVLGCGWLYVILHIFFITPIVAIRAHIVALPLVASLATKEKLTPVLLNCESPSKVMLPQI